MGGGGGSFTGDSNPADVRDKMRAAEASRRTEAFETEVNSEIATRLAGFNARDVERQRALLNDLMKQLEDDVAGSTELVFGGSVAKHTYVDGLSDVDALVLVEATERTKPDGLLQRFARRIAARYGADAVRTGELAVSVTIDGTELQLLPALKSGQGVKIAAPGGKQWAKIDPQRFTRRLTQANKQLSGKLIPTIKMAKAILAQLPEDRRPSGYHVEALAIAAFRGYSGPKTHKRMLLHFFDQATARVLKPTRDSTGQSRYLDEYLGDRNSLARKVMANSFGRIARRMRNADGAGDVRQWGRILDG